MLRKPTLIHVAKKADVSTATVSRVVHGRGYVSADAKARVEAAIEETGYRLNYLAQSLRRQRTKTIGHLLTSITPNPFFAGVELGVEHEAIRNGYSVLIWNVFEDPQRELLGVEAFLQRQVDAIIFTTPLLAKNVQLALDAQIPVIQVERPTEVESHAVVVDNYTGAVSAVEHLISLGHSNIGFIGGGPNQYQTKTTVDAERLAGFRDAMARHGLQVRKEWFALGTYYSMADGALFMERFLETPGLTAVFATCDILAAGALQALYRKGLKVPQDISLVGFDDTYASYLSPPLTTVEQPMFEIGRTAARLAIEALETPGQGLQTVFRKEHLATRLVERASTGKPHH